MSGHASLGRLLWPSARLTEALLALARATGLELHGAGVAPEPAPERLAELDLDRWLDATCTAVGIECEATQARHNEVAALLTGGPPMLVQITVEGETRFAAVLSGGRGRVRLVCPDGRRRTIAVRTLQSAVCEPVTSPIRARVEELVEAAGVAGRRRVRARDRLVEETLAAHSIGGFWMLHLPPSAPFAHQLRASRLATPMVLAVACHVLQYLVLLASWWLVGRGALRGLLDPGWLLAWGLLLLSVVPLRMATVWLQGRFTLGTGALLKRRLLWGLLNLDLDSTRGEGIGRHLSRVLEVEAFENLAIGGGYRSLLALLEAAVTALVLAAGAGGLWHAAIFVAFSGVLGMVAASFWRARTRWTQSRVGLTHDLVERMVGHRTRLVQQAPEQWHADEDAALAPYLELSRRMDRRLATLSLGWIAWTLVGIAGLAAPVLLGTATMEGIAVAIGGVILGGQALRRFVEGLNDLTGAAIAWNCFAPVFAAGARRRRVPSPHIESSNATDRPAAAPVLEARDLHYRHPGRVKPAVDNADLAIADGDQILLQGPSGGGKSTLASLLSAIRAPQAGLLLLHGLDCDTLGEEGWRRKVALAPQFHENHVLTETLAFNALMGRRWPPTSDDLEELDQILRELGLGDLIDRMPSGLLQMVGDTGWQLSHGERSRLYVARALLQNADLVILDESFGALDPESLQQAMDCVKRRARSLMVVAHT